ncbi:MAG: hypothetical protein V3V81_01645 [Candidatus Bathyarchaeia archaeon]
MYVIEKTVFEDAPMLFKQNNCITPPFLDTGVSKGIFKHVFSIIHRLAENQEYQNTIYGINSITNVATSNKEEKSGFALTSIIPDYERIGVECFRFNSNVRALWTDNG